jgi:uncharacterized protein DUF4333
MQTLLTLLFVAAVGAAGAYVATRPTVMDGNVLAADMQKQLEGKGVKRVECDRSIPITKDGATFNCTNYGADGESAQIRYTMDRNGSYKGEEDLLERYGREQLKKFEDREERGTKGSGSDTETTP